MPTSLDITKWRGVDCLRSSWEAPIVFKFYLLINWFKFFAKILFYMPDRTHFVLKKFSHLLRPRSDDLKPVNKLQSSYFWSFLNPKARDIPSFCPEKVWTFMLASFWSFLSKVQAFCKSACYLTLLTARAFQTSRELKVRAFKPRAFK
jgi:hypothetical protein